jgi:hypothetical protein
VLRKICQSLPLVPLEQHAAYPDEFAQAAPACAGPDTASSSSDRTQMFGAGRRDRSYVRSYLQSLATAP